jgi:hypothetical protein
LNYRSPKPHCILGDDVNGSHSSAIIIGRRAVLACAHSLGLLKVGNSRGKTSYKYLEDYWIQPSLPNNATGKFTADDRVPLKLFKFHESNDWALFVRTDGRFFAPEEVVSVDRSPMNNPSMDYLLSSAAVMMHYPFTLNPGVRKTVIMPCQAKSIIQGQFTHHITYPASGLCRTSSGGGLYLSTSTSVLGMHVEANCEAECDADGDTAPYPPFEPSRTPPPTKKRKVDADSETITSVAGGNNGIGCALIICKFPRLMHYIDELEK